MNAIFVSGTWARRKGKVDAWLRTGSPFQEMLSRRGIYRLHDEKVFWSDHEAGLIVEDIYDVFHRQRRDQAWIAGGKNIAAVLDWDPRIDLVVAHSHGNNCTACAAVGEGHLLRNTLRRVRWLAIDPPVRREQRLQAGYEYWAKWSPGIVQTVSGTWNWRSWPRWAGSRRLPWDRAHLPGAVVYDQPDGHSAVLDRAANYEDWWDKVIAAVKEERG